MILGGLLDGQPKRPVFKRLTPGYGIDREASMHERQRADVGTFKAGQAIAKKRWLQVAGRGQTLIHPLLASFNTASKLLKFHTFTRARPAGKQCGSRHESTL